MQNRTKSTKIEIKKNNSNEKRYSIAFNFYVRGKFGKEEYQLEIK